MTGLEQGDPQRGRVGQADPAVAVVVELEHGDRLGRAARRRQADGAARELVGGMAERLDLDHHLVAFARDLEAEASVGGLELAARQGDLAAGAVGGQAHDLGDRREALALGAERRAERDDLGRRPLAGGGLRRLRAHQPVAERLARPARAHDPQQGIDLVDLDRRLGVQQPQALLGPAPQGQGFGIGQLAISHGISLLGTIGLAIR